MLRDTATSKNGVAFLANDDVVLEEMLDSEWRSLPFMYAFVISVRGRWAPIRAWTLEDDALVLPVGNLYNGHVLLVLSVDGLV